MSITKIYQSADGKIAKVKQDSDKLSAEQELQLREALGGTFFEVGDEKKSRPTKVGETRKTDIYTARGRFTGADYKTGVDNNAFRMGFANLNNNKERSAYLRKKVGDDGYVIDKQGTYLLTPKGQQKLNEDSMFGTTVTNNLKAIDADNRLFSPKTWEGEDFADFLGAYGIPTAMAVGTMLPGPLSSAKRISQLFPKLAKNPTGYGYLLTRNLYEGMAFGLGRTLDEVQQKLKGVSRETMTDAMKDGAYEGMVWWALPGFGFEALFKGVGGLLAGKKPLKDSGSISEKVLAEEMEGQAKLGLRGNPLGVLGRQSMVLGMGVDLAQSFTGQYAKNAKANVDLVLDKIIKDQKLDKSKINNESITELKELYADYMTGKVNNTNNLVDEATKNLQESIKINVDDIFKHVDQNKTFDDVAELYEGNKGLFYTNFGYGSKALDADNVYQAAKIVDDNKIYNQKTGDNLIDITSVKQARESVPLNQITNEQQAILRDMETAASRMTPDQQQLSGLTPEDLAIQKQTYIDANATKIQNGDQELQRTLTMESAERLAENPNVRASQMLARFYGEGTEDVAEDTFITILKPDEIGLSKLELGVKLTEGGVRRPHIRIGKDSYGNQNVKSVFPVNLKNALNDLQLSGVQGLRSIPIFDKVINSDKVVPLTFKEYGDVLTGINEFNLVMQNADYAHLKNQTMKLLDSSFDDLDQSTFRMADNIDEAKEIRKLYKDAGIEMPKNLVSSVNALAQNFDHGLKMRQMFKEFRESTDNITELQIFDQIAKGEVDANKIFSAMQNNPTFINNVVKALEDTASAKELIKGGPPKNYAPNLLKERQNELADEFLNVGLQDLSGNPLFDEATLKRLGKNIALTEQFPNMMNAAGNAKEIRKRLAQLYIENMGNSPTGLNLAYLKKDLDKAFQPQAASKKLQESTKTKTRNTSVMDVLLKDEPLLKKSLSDLNNALDGIDPKILKDTNIFPARLLDEKLNVLPEGEIDSVTKAVDDFNNIVKEQEDLIKSQSFKMIENGEITSSSVADILTKTSYDDLKKLKDTQGVEFQKFKELAFGGLVKETNKEGDEILSVLNANEIVKNITERIGKKKYNLLFETPDNPNPYDGVVEVFKALDRVTEKPAIGGIAKVGLQYRVLRQVMPIGLLGAGIGAATASPGLIYMGLGLTAMKFIAAAGTSPKLARALTAEIKAINPEESFFKDYVKSRNAIEKLILSPEGLKPLGIGLEKNLEEAEQAYMRANEIYGAEIGFAGAVSTLPSVQAVQERQREVNRGLMNPLREPLPSIQSAIQRQRQVGSSMPLPQVNPVQLPNRRALAGNNPNTQDLADRLR